MVNLQCGKNKSLFGIAPNFKRVRLVHAALFATIVLGSIGWGLAVYWILRPNPWHRLVLASQAGRLMGREGKVVLIGDSILHAVGSPCATFANLAQPGARARDVPGEIIEEAAKHNPGVILIMIGINDLRTGDSPDLGCTVCSLSCPPPPDSCARCERGGFADCP